MTDFARLLTALVAGSVDFVLIGGLAGAAHGASRLTEDLDVLYDRDRVNLRRLAEALVPLQPYLRGVVPGLPFVLDTATLERGLNFTLTTAAGPLDLLGEAAGIGAYRDVVDHTVTLDLFGLPVRCLDLPTLIRSKRACGRPKDLLALAELEALLEERGD